MQENLLLSKLQLSVRQHHFHNDDQFLLLLWHRFFISYKRRSSCKSRIALLERKEWEACNLQGQLDNATAYHRSCTMLGYINLYLAAEVLKSDQEEETEVNIIADRASEMAGKMNDLYGA